MKWVAMCSAILAVPFCFTQIGNAASRSIEVTPESIGKQPLTLRVETEAYSDGTIRFDVFVSAGQHEVSPRREGRLEIARQDVPYPKYGKASLPLSVWCGVQEAKNAGELEYSFGLAREMLSKSSFEFRNYEPTGMPSMDVYVFRLDLFTPKKG